MHRKFAIPIFIIVLSSCWPKAKIVRFIPGTYASTSFHGTGSGKFSIFADSSYYYQATNPVRMVSKGTWYFDEGFRQIILITDSTFLEQFNKGNGTVDSIPVNLTRRKIGITGGVSLFF